MNRRLKVENLFSYFILNQFIDAVCCGINETDNCQINYPKMHMRERKKEEVNKKYVWC